MNIVLFREDEINRVLPLSDPRAKHCLKILHKKVGDSVEAGIINGCRGMAQITAMDENGLVFSFSPRHNAETNKAVPRLVLIIGFPRPIQLKRLLRDVTSVGVDEIHLCATELGEKSYLNSSLTQDDKLHRSLMEGAMQAKSTLIPKIFIHKNLPTAISATKTSDAICLDVTENSQTLANLLEGDSDETTLLAIGSERGWSENERQLFRDENFKFATMGRRILRTETAAICAAFLFRTLRGEND